MRRNYILENLCDHDLKSNNHYVYLLINPTTKLPFYVGKGREDRAWRHISLRNNVKLHKANPHKTNTINQIIDKDNERVIVQLYSTHILESDAFNTERDLIIKYGRRCDSSGILTNIANGGQGKTTDGRAITQYTLWGQKITDYKNAKEACRLNGWKHYSTISGCCNRRETSYMGFLWTYKDDIPKLRTKIKPIYQWSLDGILIYIHANVMAAGRFLQVEHSSIGDCAKGFLKTARGFKWTYGEHPDTAHYKGRHSRYRLKQTELS